MIWSTVFNLLNEFRYLSMRFGLLFSFTNSFRSSLSIMHFKWFCCSVVQHRWIWKHYMGKRTGFDPVSCCLLQGLSPSSICNWFMLPVICSRALFSLMLLLLYSHLGFIMHFSVFSKNILILYKWFFNPILKKFKNVFYIWSNIFFISKTLSKSKMI